MAYKLPSIETFYTGSYGMEPGDNYGDVFTGYRLAFNKLGAPTSPQTANQISEVTSRLSEGNKVVELQPIQPEVFETIPKQQLQEVKQLMKLTGAEPTLHGPMIDPAGFTREGWTEHTRQEAERQLLMSVERAQELDPKGNIPVTFHVTGGVPSSDPLPGKGPNEKSILYVVDPETGKLDAIPRQKMAYPTPFYSKDDNGIVKLDENGQPKLDPRVKRIEENGRVFYDVPPEVRLEEYNTRGWIDKLSGVEYEKSIIENRIGDASKVAQILHLKKQLGEELSDDEEKNFQRAMMELKRVNHFMGDFENKLREYYHVSYSRGGQKDRDILKKATENYRQSFQEITDIHGRINEEELIEKDPAKFAKIVELRSKAEQDLINSLRKTQPKMWVSSEEFALDKTKETISNVALRSFKQFGEKSPVISLENFFPNTVFSRAESLRKLVEESRRAFVEKAKQEGFSEGQAKSAAEKLIGVTWDTGHINMIRKHGYGENEKGIFDEKKFAKILSEETKKIAPFVKHVHLTDNFGYNDTHLPPGMGDVPFKDILRELEKAGYSGKNIVEAGGFAAHKMGAITPHVLEAFGSPIYGAAAKPYWNQMRGGYGFPQGYFSGYGMMLPEQHFSTYGSGFSTLPQELGGQMPGKGQRFSGTPME